MNVTSIGKMVAKYFMEECSTYAELRKLIWSTLTEGVEIGPFH